MYATDKKERMEKNMKAAAWILALILGWTALLPAGAAEEEEFGAMDVNLTALELTRLMGNGTNLGNTLEACNSNLGAFSENPTDFETLWGQPVTTQEMLTALKDAGFDTVRVPVAWMTNATRLGEGDYTISEAYLDRVEEVIQYALRADMYVIVNDHWDGGWYGMFGSDSAETRALAMEAYKGMWSQIATRYAKYGDHLIFEGANEEIGARFDEDSRLYCSDSMKHILPDNQRYELANQVNQAFVDTVRAAGGNNENRFLLIPGYGTNIEQTCDPRFKMPTDTAKEKLLISVHYYDPWSYAGASSAAGATKWGTKKDFDDMNKTLSRMQKFTAQGYGVVIGEYGALPGSNGVMKDNALAYHKNFLDNCDLYNYVGCLWDTSGFYVRKKLAFSDEGMAALYDRARFDPEKDEEEVKAAARDALEAALSAAPDTFLENAIVLTDDTCVAWIMWSSGDWAQSYSVGDTYTPDSVTQGLKVQDAVIDGPGEYTVSLDFTGTEQGYSSSVAFSALGISNGEILHPGWAVHIVDLQINGQSYKMTGRPYTTSDDGKCTRVNLFNEWVTALPADARVLYGPPIGISAVLINRNDEVISHIETISVTFKYEPKAN